MLALNLLLLSRMCLSRSSGKQLPRWNRKPRGLLGSQGGAENWGGSGRLRVWCWVTRVTPRKEQRGRVGRAPDCPAPLRKLSAAGAALESLAPGDGCGGPEGATAGGPRLQAPHGRFSQQEALSSASPRWLPGPSAFPRVSRNFPRKPYGM